MSVLHNVPVQHTYHSGLPDFFNSLGREHRNQGLIFSSSRRTKLIFLILLFSLISKFVANIRIGTDRILKMASFHHLLDSSKLLDTVAFLNLVAQIFVTI